MRALLMALVVALAVPASAARVLVFSKTAGFRHASIGPALAALSRLAAERGWTLEATEDASLFSDASLAGRDVVVFLLTTGDVLDAEQQGALERFVRRGGGWVGVHSASDTEYDWPFYGALVGAYFAGHPSPQTATVRVEDAEHPATRDLPAAWTRFDEWYNFREAPRARPGLHVLATLDESTYTGGTMGADHPIAWCQRIEGGRAFYTALGHTDESYGEAAFLGHLMGGIAWAAGEAPGACGEPPPVDAGPPIADAPPAAADARAPDRGGGCSAGGHAQPAAAWWLLLLAMFVRRRK